MKRALWPPRRLVAKARRRRADAASAGIRGLPASDARFPCSVLRANPFSEVTDPFCRLPLPTFIRLTRGFSPWRPDAVMGTIGRDTAEGSSRFSRARRGAPDAATSAALCQRAAPSRRANQFQGACAVKKKRQLFPEPRRASLDSVALPRLPHPGARILTLFSFGGARGEPALASLSGGALESTNPCPNAVHMEPFSTSVFKGFI
jgi:hypothetical protein